MCFDGAHRGRRTNRTVAERLRSALGRVHMSMGASEGDNNAEVMRVWLLGGFRVSVGSRTIGEDRWRRRKAAALVKLLALAPCHRLHREQVMHLLWPRLGPQAAANNLHRNLYVARRNLGPRGAHRLPLPDLARRTAGAVPGGGSLGRRGGLRASRRGRPALTGSGRLPGGHRLVRR